jgi:hypothetical protein
MQSLHHILLDLCKYLMMQSSLWKMVRTRTSEDTILDILEGFASSGSSSGAPPKYRIVYTPPVGLLHRPQQ